MYVAAVWLGCGSSDAIPADSGVDGVLDGSMLDGSVVLDGSVGEGEDASDASDVRDAGAHDAETDTNAGTGCAAAPTTSELDWTIEHDGRERRARVVLPDGYDAVRRWPLVLSIHALGSNAGLQESYTRMTEAARARGFVVIYPEGTGGSWNAGTCCGTATARVDDVGFLAAVLDRAERELCVDVDRVHATGMSNGGYMTHRLGCELADRLASIAPVAGADATTRCAPTRPLPVHLHHGTLDTVVPYLAGAQARDAWRTRNACTDESEVFFDEGGTTCERWRCDAVVEQCRSTVGHVWPGGVASPAGIDATSAVLEFFEAHPRR